MRKALNDNPIVQVVMLGALGIVVAFLFMTRVMGQEESGGSATSGDATATVPPAPEATVPAEAPAAPEMGAVPGTAPAPAPAAGEFRAGPGLPESVNSKAPEDRHLEAEVNALRGRSDTSVFVAEAKDVSRYSRIAEGVNLDRVPALVVVEPKRQVEGALPLATISYGFRGPESVEQAVRDVLYDGKQLSYAPD